MGCCFNKVQKEVIFTLPRELNVIQNWNFNVKDLPGKFEMMNCLDHTQ